MPTLHGRVHAFALPLTLIACTNAGPATIPRDRFDYSAAITESWKRQTLLNIVKLRYLDPPIFVDVGQIVAGYTIESSGSVGGAVSGDPAGAAIGGSSATLGGSIRYTDRPTITYLPMTGNRFVQGLMTPLPPESVFQAIAAGWPADGILAAAVSSLNGMHNMRVSVEGVLAPDARFLRVLQLMRDIQREGALGLRVRKDGPGGAGTLLFVRHRDVPDELKAKGQELRALLGLAEGAEEFRLSFGAIAQDDTEIAVVTRSVLHIMTAMATGVEVPQSDVDEERCSPGLAPGNTQGCLVRILSSESAPPDDAYVVVPYRNRWFWIDDRDLRSKRAFAFMMMLFTMADPATPVVSPVVTIPA